MTPTHSHLEPLHTRKRDKGFLAMHPLVETTKKNITHKKWIGYSGFMQIGVKLNNIK